MRPLKGAFLGTLAGVALLSACSKAQPEATGGKGAGAGRKLEYPVQVAPLALRHVRYTVTAPGTIDAFQQVQITARVAGAVDKVAFAEGQQVTAGQVLVNIESDRYQVAVDQAKAVIAKSQATQHQAEQQLARRKGADSQHPGLITGEEIATFETSVATAKADVASSQQALRVAELNLRDSYVRAPIAGVVQTRTVQTGQYLQAGAVLATILQRDPMLLRFQVSEQDAPRLKVGMSTNITLHESAHTFTASIALVAGSADPATRLVPVTATLDATTHQYWLRPGAFCEVNVPVGDARDAIVIPTLAMQPTDKGNIAYIVEGTSAKTRQIETGMHTPEGGVEVTRGLAAGDLLVVRGIDALTDGAPIKITERTTIEAIESRDGGTPSPAASGAASAASATAAPGADGSAAAAGSAPHAHKQAQGSAP